MNTTANTAASRPGTANAARSAEDNPSLHPGRELCYYFKPTHTFLAHQVELGNIKYDTALEIEVEHCTMTRPAISLRASYSDKHAQAGQYNRYIRNWEMLEEEVHSNLENDANGVRMWSVKVSSNNPRILGPKAQPEALRKARLGAFEIILSWQSAGGGSRQQIVLFSKLNSLRFPNPPDVVEYLVRTLAPARSTRFTVYARELPSGLGCRGALVNAEQEGAPEGRKPTGVEKLRGESDKNGQIELVLPFGVFMATAEIYRGGPDPANPEVSSGHAKFDVHGQLLKSVCVPVCPPMAPGQVRVACTWAEFPHEVSMAVKTPYGIVRSHPAGEDEAPGVPHAAVECVPTEGGFGPISVLIDDLVEGRYHVFCKCKPYAVGSKMFGWKEANAQVTLFGVGGSEPLSFSRMAGDEGDYWDICFIEVAAGGKVSVREFNAVQVDEPGNRMVTIVVRDMSGQPVAGAKVSCQAEGRDEQVAVEVRDLGDTGADGTIEALLPLGEYTANVTAAEYIRTTVKLVVDLDPQVAGVTVPMVKDACFVGSSDLLCVLSWAGDAIAKLVIETPGRLLKVPEEGEEDPYGSDPSRSMLLRGTNPVGALLAPPDPNLCGGDFTDFIWVECGEGMDVCNMQLSVFTKDGLLQTMVPPPELLDGTSTFWAVGEVVNGMVDTVGKSTRAVECPARGKTFRIRTIPARPEECETAISAEVTVETAKGDLVRSWKNPPKPDDVDYSRDGEFALFLPFGEYNVEATDPMWFSPLRMESINFTKSAVPSLGMCMVEKKEIDAKTAFVTLSWAGMPSELDLCIRSHDGTVTSQNKSESKATVIKGVKYETSNKDGFGPKVLSFTQPLVGKFRLYVLNRNLNEKVSLYACNPQVNIILYTGIWRRFQIEVQKGIEVEDGHMATPCWHVADLKVENDTKMGEQCIECVEVNKLVALEPAIDS